MLSMEGRLLNYCIRCQHFEVSGRMQQESWRNKDGKLVYACKVLRKKCDLYCVDCNVAGSSCGTVDDPKFVLLTYFGDLIFESVKDMVKVSGKFEGYVLIIQGDNAGPHQDATFKRGVEEGCVRKGWYWIPQGPQITHMNVCDLLVF